MNDFERCLKVILGAEGGYSDHPADKGGKTNMGITEGTLANAYSKGIVPHKDIKKLTRDEAANIYKVNYWVPSKAAEMAYPLCLLHFDAAVNHGLGGAAKLLQRTINRIKGPVLKVDGVVGPATIKEVRLIPSGNLIFFCVELLKTRKEYFEAIAQNNPSQKVFLKGWLNRVEALRKYL